jgi:hypothetical protein
MEIAKNYDTNRFYRVDLRQMRYFPIKKEVAEIALATGKATECEYLPFGRPDLWHASRAAKRAIEAASR